MSSGLSASRLVRLRDHLQRYVDSGAVPGALAVLARRGSVEVVSVGTLAFDSSAAFGMDTICRIASMSKPLVAACVMSLVEDCTLRLDDPVDDLLPELASMRVLALSSEPVSETVAAERSITLRDLLVGTAGTGMVITPLPIAAALDALDPHELGPDEWLRQLGELPLVHQPGARWMYDTPSQILGVLVARATGRSLGSVLQERVCEPLGLIDTGFVVPPGSLQRFATAYQRDGSGANPVEDPPEGRFSRPRRFESGGGGLVSTAQDYLAFASALMSGGGALLSRPSVELMTMDHLTPAQKDVAAHWMPGYFDAMGWGFGVGVTTRRTTIGPTVGSYGWAGYYGTMWQNDPAEQLTTILMLQQGDSPPWAPFSVDFWTLVYAAIDD